MSVPDDPRLRRIGWLLTPLLVWAAAFGGAWIGAVVAGRTGGPWGGLGVMLGAAVGLVVAAVALWALLLRPRRREPPGGAS